MARPRKPLSRERVLDAAVRLADDGGIEALSMRRLARELGVEAMSLYNHVESKADLVDGMVDLVVAEIALPADEPEWDVAIRKCAISAHDAFVQHPWACSLVIGPGATRTLPMPRLRYMEWLLGRLRDAGFSAELTYHAYHVLDAHVVGFTLWQLGHEAGARTIAGSTDLDEFMAGLIARLRTEGFPNLAEHGEQHLSPPDDRSAFEFGLDLILDGLARALGD
jgi:AcrR family transcriptional regulator